jgi:hypothetical protein
MKFFLVILSFVAVGILAIYLVSALEEDPCVPFNFPAFDPQSYPECLAQAEALVGDFQTHKEQLRRRVIRGRCRVIEDRSEAEVDAVRKKIVKACEVFPHY